MAEPGKEYPRRRGGTTPREKDDSKTKGKVLEAGRRSRTGRKEKEKVFNYNQKIF